MFKKSIVALMFLLIAVCTLSFTACEKEESAASVENYVLESVYEIEERCGAGVAGCYELVFPVTVILPDSTTQEVASYDELKQAIRDYFEANGGHPRPHVRPNLVFPFDVLNEAGEIITVATQEELRALRQACIGANFGNGHHGHLGRDRACFRPVFPLTVQFPDSTQVTVASQDELKQAARDWREAHPGVHGRTEFVFPITVELRDGTQVIVNTREELRALKEDCRG